ncbi:unnamed protein product, partial [Brenthis ino]
MRLYTFVALCACALYVRAASIPSSEKKIDDLDNVDLDNVESELVDQPIVQDLDNNLRKASDIRVKVIEEPVVLDENSNDYIPNKDESINIKRLEIDLNNPGPPQRQEHETQNPENYGEKEKGVYAIIQKTKEAESVYTKGLKEVSDSLLNINEESDKFPVVLENLKNFNESFSIEIEKLNDTIRSHLESKPAELDGESQKDPKLKIVESAIQNLKLNFKIVVDTLNEGIELLSIIRDQDEPIKSATKALVKEEIEAVKESASNSATQPAAQGSGSSNWFSSLTAILQNFLPVNNNMNNIFQNFSFPNIISGSGGQSSTAQQPTKPSGAQSDESAPASSAPAPGIALWTPQGIFHNIIQLISRPSQSVSQQPTNSNSTPEKEGAPPKQPEKESGVQADAIPPPVSASAASPAPAKAEDQQPVQPAILPQAAPEQQAVVTPEQPAQSGPIQQFVQNNPIIKGIQSAVQRLQGSPNSETPRNEIVENDMKEDAELENKGHYGDNSANQGHNNDSNGVDKKIEEQKEEAPAAQEAAVEVGIKAEETKPLTNSDKTE